MQCLGAYGRYGGNNIMNSFIHKSLSLSLALNPDGVEGRIIVMMSKKKISNVSMA